MRQASLFRAGFEPASCAVLCLKWSNGRTRRTLAVRDTLRAPYRVGSSLMKQKIKPLIVQAFLDGQIDALAGSPTSLPGSSGAQPRGRGAVK